MHSLKTTYQRIEERDILEQLVDQAMACRTFLTKIVNFSLAYLDKDLNVVSEKLITAVEAIEVASGRLLGGLQKPKIQQIQQHLKEYCDMDDEQNHHL
ncbi:hypothetical protein CMV_020441 [Castanea mollissima]|uniref:Uncharacterized protein n=1 Tax=Castanea mollissima TaxID=60419 RepID=A0A8J4VMP8_9ROSI|nr:hypothetical protein CMV_020441 [Castanea mollissima]